MADDINNNEGMDEAGDAGLPVLSRARMATRTPITPMPMMMRKKTTTASSRRALAKSTVVPRPERISTVASSRFRSSAVR